MILIKKIIQNINDFKDIGFESRIRELKNASQNVTKTNVNDFIKNEVTTYITHEEPSSSDESADEDGKYSCIFFTKKFDRKDFKEYHEFACFTGSKEIVFTPFLI